MKKSTGLLIGLLILLVLLTVPAFAGEPPSGDSLPGVYAASAGPVLTTPPTTQVPVRVLAAKVTTPPAGGALMLASTPAGASAYVDGSLRGTTPLSLSDVPLGPHTVTFSKAGYMDYTTKTTVTALAVAKVTGMLVPAPTTIATTTLPTIPSPGITRITPTERISVSPITPVPVSTRRTVQPDSSVTTTRCIRHYSSGSGETGPAPGGRVTCTIVISTGDGIVTLSIPEGTRVTGAGNLPVPMIHLTPVIVGEVPYGAREDGLQWTGRACHFLPDGASFDPPAQVSFTLGQNEWDRSDPSNMTIMASGGTGTDWESLPTQADPSTRSLSAPVTHFSIMGLFSRQTPPEGPAAPPSRLSLEDRVKTATRSSRGPLPLSPILPDPYAPLAAVAAGIVISAAALTSGGTMLLSRLGNWILDLLGQFLGSEATGFLSAAEIEKRSIRPAENLAGIVLGLSSREIAVIGISGLGFALAFILQAGLELELATVLVCLCAGGVSTILHDLAHKFGAYRAGCVTEYQFWGLGTGILLLTAWLFGNAFAKPSRNIIRSERPLSAEESAVIRLCGPVASIAIAVLSLLLIPLGGFFLIAGSAGFTMNLLNAVFSLLPVQPNDGVEIYAWNRIIWAAVFVPLMLFYLYTYMVL